MARSPSQPATGQETTDEGAAGQETTDEGAGGQETTDESAGGQGAGGEGAGGQGAAGNQVSEKELNLLINEVLRHLTLPSDPAVRNDFWTKTLIKENEGTRQIFYVDQRTQKSAGIVADELDSIRGRISDPNEAMDAVEALVYNESDADRDLTHTNLYKIFAAKYYDQPADTELLKDTGAAWVLSVQEWHNLAVDSGNYLQALTEAATTIRSLGAALEKAKIAADGTADGSSAGQTGAPSYVSPAILRYLRHKNWRDARNERRRAAYSRLAR